MNWTQSYYSLSPDVRAQAALMSLAWRAASQQGDPALLSNLSCNLLSPSGVLQCLDYAGIQAPAIGAIKALGE